MDAQHVSTILSEIFIVLTVLTITRRADKDCINICAKMETTGCSSPRERGEWGSAGLVQHLQQNLHLVLPHHLLHVLLQLFHSMSPNLQTPQTWTT